MVYYGTGNIECIQIHEAGNPNNIHTITLEKMSDSPTFKVEFCCDPTWEYEFYLENNSDYERIKLCIMESVLDCESIDELLDTLSDVFEDGFEDIFVEGNHKCRCKNNGCECEGNCKENKYLN